MTGESVTVGIVGGGGLAERLRDRVARSRLTFRVVEGGEVSGAPDVLVRLSPAPEPNYLGVSSADHPGELFLTDAPALDHVLAVLEQLAVSGATTMRVRRPIQSEWTAIGSQRLRRKRLRHFDPDHYDWIGTESVDEDVYDGDLLLTAVHDTADDEIRAHTRLLGYLDPHDGHYHWVGTVFGPQVRAWKENRISAVTVSTPGGDPVEARLAEITPSRTVRIVGIGTPPYEREPLIA